MNHSSEKHKRLYSLFRDTGTLDIRHDLVEEYSEGRTKKSEDLTQAEIDSLINVLQGSLGGARIQVDAGQRMRRRIFSLCYTLGYTKVENNRQIVDKYRLNAWMLKYSYLHKPLMQYGYDELVTLVTQFENFVKSEL